MHAFPIRNDEDLSRAIALVSDLWDARPGTIEHDLLHVMSELIDAYEARHSSLPAGDPLEVIAFKLRELGWSQMELGRRLEWGSGRVSEVLSGKRPLTIAMVRSISRVFGLPPGLLVHDVRGADAPVWIGVRDATAVALASDAAQVGRSSEDHAHHLLVDALVRRASTSLSATHSATCGPSAAPTLRVLEGGLFSTHGEAA